MTTQDIKSYRENLEQKELAEIAAVKKRYERKLAALSVLLEDAGEMMESVNGSAIEAKSFSDAVKIAIEKSLDGFTSVSVFHIIAAHFPDLAKGKSPADVSAPLWVLKELGQIEVMTQGAGRRPSVYRKTARFASRN